MIDLPPQLILPEKPALIMPAPALIRPEKWWVANLPGLIPGAGLVAAGGGAAEPLTITHTAGTNVTSGTNPHSFSSISIGAAPGAGERRWVFVAWTNRRTDDEVTSATIAGVTATDASSISNATNGRNSMSFWYAEVPTGTTGTMLGTYTNPGTMDRQAISVWRVISDTGGIQIADTHAVQLSSGGQAMDLVVPEGGVTMIGAVTFNGGPWSFAGDITTADYAVDLAAGEDVGMSSSTETIGDAGWQTTPTPSSAGIATCIVAVAASPA